MGGCLRAGQTLGLRASEEESAPAAKIFDVFVSHHQGVADDGAQGPDLTGQFAKWVSEVCESLGLRVFFDKTNLSRVLDESKFRHDVKASRIVIAIVSGASLGDAHGMQQELWWASRTRIPIVPFYNGDQYETEDFAMWQRAYSYALSRPPIVYRRRAHLKVRDGLRTAIYDALMEAGGGTLPSSCAETLTHVVERQRKRERRVERSSNREARGVGVGKEPDLIDALTGRAEAVGKDPGDIAQRRKKEAKDIAAGTCTSTAKASSVPSTALAGTTSLPGDKRFRFRDEGMEDKSTGVQWLVKSLRDPMGRQEQEQRQAVLEGTEVNGVEEGSFVPRHHIVKPPRGILKGARAAASAAAEGPSKYDPGFEKPVLSPELEEGVNRLLEYLLGLGPDDNEQLPNVLQILRLTLPNCAIATRALSIIFEFISAMSRCRQVVEQNGSIPDIVKAMTIHKDFLDLQTYGCGCLYALSCFQPGSAMKDNNSAAIAHAGGIYRLLDAMNAFPSCREVQQWGAGALRHLAVEIGANRREISDHGEVQLTMRGINKRVITKSGGIEAIVSAMNRFQDEDDVQENGCAALCNLITSGPESKVRAARAGSIRASIRAIQTFSDEPELVQFACALLRSLAMGVPENKIGIVAQGGVRQLCVALARHRGDAEVCAQAVAALCNLTSQMADNKREIVDAGGLELAVAAMRATPDASELQQQGCGLLHNLACERSLKAQVASAGGGAVAEAAAEHQDTVVKSLGQMLRRQLQDGDIRCNEGGDPTSPSAAGEDAIEGLFAPWRVVPTGSGGVVRGKTLTRPQRKMMANVMDSMRKDPGAWLSTDDSEDGGSTDGKRKTGGADSARSDGGWTGARYGEAADFGVEDLEGLSDTENAPNDFKSILRRGLARRGPAKRDRPSSREHTNDSGSGVDDFVVRRKRPGDDGSPPTSARSNASNSDELGFVVRRGQTSARSDASTGLPKSDDHKSSRTVASSEGTDYVVRRGEAHKSPRSVASGEESDYVVRRGEAHKSPRSVVSGEGTDYVVRRGETRKSPRSIASSEASDYVVRRGETHKSPRSVASSDGNEYVVRRGAKSDPGSARSAANASEENGASKLLAPEFSPPSRGAAATNASAEIGAAAVGGMDCTAGESRDEAVGKTKRRAVQAAAAAETPVANDAASDAGQSATGDGGLRTATARAPSAGASDAGSDASDGAGWIDFDDDDALKRIERRVRKQQRREAAQMPPEEEESAGARLLREMLGEGESALRSKTKPRVKRSKSSIKFARALKRCGDAPPEKWDENWKEAVMLRHQALSRTGWEQSARATTMVLDGLDGVVRGASRNLRRRQEQAVEGALRRAEQAGGLARQIRQEGIKQVVQSSSLGRRWAYGLDDDEDSIYGLDDLEDLGEAEAALLDAIGQATAAEEEEEEDLTSPVAAASGRQSARGDESARLQALSKRLESRREDKRRVKML